MKDSSATEAERRERQDAKSSPEEAERVLELERKVKNNSATAAERQACKEARARHQLAHLSSNFKISDAQDMLEGVRFALNGMSPHVCQLVASLAKAEVVIGSLRMQHLVGDVDFQRALARARMQASTDEHASTKLDQLIPLREVVKPWLKKPVTFEAVVAAVNSQLRLRANTQVTLFGLVVTTRLNGEAARVVEFDQAEDRYKVRLDSGEVAMVQPTNLQPTSSDDAPPDVMAERLTVKIENVCRRWQHTLSYFDGTNEGSAGADLVQRVELYMRGGRYLGKLSDASLGTPEQLVFKYAVEDDDGTGAGGGASCGSAGRGNCGGGAGGCLRAGLSSSRTRCWSKCASWCSPARGRPTRPSGLPWGPSRPATPSRCAPSRRPRTSRRRGALSSRPAAS